VISFNPPPPPGRFTAREIAPGAYWIRGWVGPKAGLDAVKQKIAPLPVIEPRPSGA
jgi:hypothetical protein